MALSFNPLFPVSTHLKTPILFPSIVERSVIYRVPSISNTLNSRITTTAAHMNLSWDDVVRVSQPEYFPRDDSSDLSGFFEKVNFCNRGSVTSLEKRKEFVPFLIEDQLVGYIHNGFLVHLRKFSSVFEIRTSYVTLREMLKTPDNRTKAVAEVIQYIAQEDGEGGEKLIPGIRNELYPVTSSLGKPTFFFLERAAAPYFGIKAYGVHMNGYVEKDGEKFLWLGKRSRLKPTYPGMLDHLVAGGLPHGISCRENMIKECEEEAGIPHSLASEAIPVGAVSYMDIDGLRYKRDVLFCFDLKLPEGFWPKNQDGEVDGFQLIPVSNVANIIRRTHYFKANCCLVIIDFLFRHGYVSPDSYGYLDLLQSLRSGDCS